MTVEDAEGQVVGVAVHQPHEEFVVPEVVCPGDHQGQQVEQAVVAELLEDKLPDEVEGVEGVKGVVCAG